jgi:uncharacterized protein
MTDPATANRDRLPGDKSWPDRPTRLVVNVVELRKRLGQRREVPIDVILARQEVLDSRTTAAPVLGSVTVESIERGVSLLGQVRFEWEGDCRRCLETVVGSVVADIDEICLVDAPADADIVDFDGDKLDLLPIVRDTVGLSLPLAPLCREDCPGPDPERFPAVTEEDLEAERSRPDPRWAALDRLRLDQN